MDSDDLSNFPNLVYSLNLFGTRSTISLRLVYDSSTQRRNDYIHGQFGHKRIAYTKVEVHKFDPSVHSLVFNVTIAEETAILGLDDSMEQSCLLTLSKTNVTSF